MRPNRTAPAAPTEGSDFDPRQGVSIKPASIATEDTELVLEFMYLADGRSDAEALATFLHAETDYEVEASERAVEGSTQPTTLTPAVLDEWVEWMTLAGWENGQSRFDGWGTEVPD